MVDLLNIRVPYKAVFLLLKWPVVSKKGLSIRFCALLCWAASLLQYGEAQAASYKVIYSFTNPTACCGNSWDYLPWTLFAGPDGALYGSHPTGVDNGVKNYGTIFRLAPPAKGTTDWHYSTVFEFGATPREGRFPSGFAFDRSGALYGTTSNGGIHGVGTIFKLTAPAIANGLWTRQVLTDQLSFSNAAQPFGKIYVSSSGSVFGTVEEAINGYGGGVYQLAPSSADQSKHILHILHGFSDTEAFLPRGVALGRDGALYGAGSEIWRLVPSQNAQQQWTYDALVDRQHFGGSEYSGPDAPSLDRSLNIFGASPQGGKLNLHGGDVGNGFIFKISPPAFGQRLWTKHVLYEFGDGKDGYSPSATVTEGPDGVLYGKASIETSPGACVNDRKISMNCGIVYKLVPRGFGQTYPWRLTVLHAFGESFGGSGPASDLVYLVLPDGTAGLFGATAEGGAFGYGTVFQITP